MINIKKDILVKKSIQFFSIIVAIILIILGICAVIKTGYFDNAYNEYSEKILYKTDNIILNLILIIMFLLILYAIYRLTYKIKSKYLFISVLAVYIILSIIWVCVSKTPLRADQKVVHEIATQFIEHNFQSLEEGQYLCYHPLQLGFIYFLEIIYRMFCSSNPIIYKFLNIIFSSIVMIYMYKISGIIFKSDKVQKILSILLLGNIVMIFLNVYVYGNTVGLMLGLISIYYILKYLEIRKIRYLIVSTISIILAIVLKSNFEIYLIGIILMLLMDSIKKIDYKALITIVIMIILTLTVNKAIVKITELRYGKEINKGIPMISYIHMGMAPKADRAAGWYNINVNVEKIFAENQFNIEKSSEYSKQEILKRINNFKDNPSEAFKFYIDKILSTWIEPAFQTIWINEPQEEIENVEEYISNNKMLLSLYDGIANKIIMKYLDIYDIVIFIFAGIFVILNIKKIEIKEVSLLILFFGGLAFHILWETKSIYAIPFFEILILYSAHSVANIFTIIESKIKKGE